MSRLLVAKFPEFSFFIFNYLGLRKSCIPDKTFIFFWTPSIMFWDYEMHFSWSVVAACLTLSLKQAWCLLSNPLFNNNILYWFLYSSTDSGISWGRSSWRWYQNMYTWLTEDVSSEFTRFVHLIFMLSFGPIFYGGWNQAIICSIFDGAAAALVLSTSCWSQDRRMM